MQSTWKHKNNVSLNSTQYLNLRILLMFNKQLQKGFFSQVTYFQLPANFLMLPWLIENLNNDSTWFMDR